MVAWAEYKAQAKSRGALALELFVAHSTPAKAPEDVKAALPDHLAYQAELERAGSLAFAGPMSDETGQDMQGMGLIIYRADSLEAARALADGDPMHKTGARLCAAARDDQRGVPDSAGGAVDRWDGAALRGAEMDARR